MVTVIDLGVILFSNLFNFFVAGLMLARTRRLARLERILGLMAVLIGIPMAFAMVYNLLVGRAWWLWILPGLFVLHSVVEWVLDYWLKLPFRKTRWLGPYLAIFYLAQWGLIGYAFNISPLGGYITLVTYFISLGATAYSYIRVGHGD